MCAGLSSVQFVLFKCGRLCRCHGFQHSKQIINSFLLLHNGKFVDVWLKCGVSPSLQSVALLYTKVVLLLCVCVCFFADSVR